jgi:hypothetical protein
MHSLRSGYRFFCSYWWKHWLDPKTYWYWMKCKIQRANRGWADCDIWGLDNYLSEWLPDALRRLKETKQGVPCSMFTDEELNLEDSEGWNGPDKTASERAKVAWDEVLDKIVAGFEAYNRIQDSPCSYEKEIGEWPHAEWKFEPCEDKSHLHKMVHTDEEQKAIDEWMAKEKPLLERDQKIWEEGAALFIKHFGSLWD